MASAAAARFVPGRMPPARMAGALLAGLLAASCGNAGGGGTGDPTIFLNPAPLKVLSINSDRRDDWYRNAPIVLHFSAPLSKASLDKPDVLARAIQIGIVTSKGRVPAKGSFYFPNQVQAKILNDRFHLNIGNGLKDANGDYRDWVVFDPIRTVNSDNLGCADNPFGFSALTTYTVDIPTPATSTKYLTATDGKPIIEEFSSFFKTSEKYNPEVQQPRYTGTDGQGSLGFDPPRKVNGEVPYNASVLIVFDEAMAASSFELGNTIIVKNETLSALQGKFVGVSGVFTPDLCGKTWKFVPAFSFGGGGYDIAVTLTTGLKDLPGNPLANPQTIRFRTEVKAGIPTTQSLAETFDNTTKRDTPNTTAEWGTVTAGSLTGGAVTTTTVSVQLLVAQYPGGTRTRVRDHPFAQTGSVGVGHDQWIYTQAELGAAAAITQVSWGPSSNALFAAFHNNVTVILGHTQGDSLNTTMDNNFDVGTPVKVADSSYIIPQRATIDPPCGTDACAVGFWPLPTFSDFFEYNGKNNLILDISADPGTNYQIGRILFGPVGFPNRHTFGAFGSSTGTLAEPVVNDMQFIKKRRTTIAQSLFYDSGVSNPDYSTPVILPATQTGGTQAGIEFEGAKGILFPIPSNPNNVIPDPTTFTGYVTNIDQLDGFRFVRFRATLVSNVTTTQVPVIRSIDIPYIF